MWAVPGLRAPTVAVAIPVPELVDVESIVAAIVLSDAKVIVPPVIARANWSKGWSVNCVVCPTLMLAVGGEIVTVAGCPGQLPKGVPSTFRPAENLRAPALIVCQTKPPVTPGERVSDCAAPPFNPVAPP